jgi:hypothetical protein
VPVEIVEKVDGSIFLSDRGAIEDEHGERFGQIDLDVVPGAGRGFGRTLDSVRMMSSRQLRPWIR